MNQEIKVPRKLIEVSLPLDAINIASAKEKSIRHGHPSTLHLWWARRPLAAARAVIFSQMVNDPGYERYLGRGLNKERAQKERERLFGIIERLVRWENSNDEKVLSEAREEIWKSWRETCSLNKDHTDAKTLFNPEVLPAFHDPFSGGGALPLEAQRLGLETYASDLNPVAVTIEKAMIEVPPKFAGCRPVAPEPSGKTQQNLDFEWTGVSGLAEDVRRYGKWVRDEAYKLIGENYPNVKITKDMAKDRADLKGLVGEELTVVTWLWARTVRSPNPAFAHVEVPLISNFVLSTKENKDVYIEPKVEGDRYSFQIRIGIAPPHLQDGTVNRGGAKCIISGTPIPFSYIRDEGKAKRLGSRLLAIVADSKNGRVFLPPQEEHSEIAKSVTPNWSPETTICHWPGRTNVVEYGMTTFGDLFTDRQLLALNTYSKLIGDAQKKCLSDAEKSAQFRDAIDPKLTPSAYSEAVALYLALALSRLTDISNSLCRWENTKTQVRNLFGRQAIPMMWDYAENNMFAGAAGDFETSLESLLKALVRLPAKGVGFAVTADAQTQTISSLKVISTDPPYYDNIEYADLSDFFYVWLRHNLLEIYPELFTELAVPKLTELVANPYRYDGKIAAEAHFLHGMSKAIENLALISHPGFPITIYYAFKQAETKADAGTYSTGWETFLTAILSAGFSITGTWPMRTELSNRMIGAGSNALASSVVLVCRKRDRIATTISRREFVRELSAVLPDAIQEMTSGGGSISPVAPVDLSQAVIGPGMAIFSKYTAVLEADGRPMSVRTALQLINRFFAEEDFDHDTQFCLQWFDHHGWDAGLFGEADVLARAKGTSVLGLKDAGIAQSSAGSLRLLKPSDLPPQWNPVADSRVSIWEILHHMIARFNDQGESGAGELLSRVGQFSETVRTLAYRLYTICERKGWSQDAGSYDGLVRAWDSIETAARSVGYTGTQISLFGEPKPGETISTAPKKKTRKKT